MDNRRRLTGFRIGPLLIAAVFAAQTLVANSTAQASGQQSRPSARTRVVSRASPGFYFEISPCPRCYRCRPCSLNPGWQRQIIRLLGARRISSFPGEALGLEKANEQFGVVAAIKRFARPPSYDTMIYVGPFDTEKAAIAAIAELCTVLDEAGIMESSCDDMTAKREGSTFYTRGSFDVSGVRLLPKAASN